MADNGQFSDDISALWGEETESTLVPPRADVAEARPEHVEPPETNGSHPEQAGDDAVDGVARLAQALATHQTDVVSRSELERTRSELEGAFTHQLAVALYDLLGASNDRFARTEHRLDEIARRLDESVAGHTKSLAALLEAQQRAVTADQKAVQSQLDALRDTLGRLNQPLDELSTAQRNVRLGITGLTDAVRAQGVEAVKRAEARASDDEAAQRALTDHMGESSEKIDDLSARITAVQEQVAGLSEALVDLRKAVGGRVRRRRLGRRD